VVGSDYFKTLDVPVLRGRGFTLAEEQDANAPAVAVIDEPAARALFPDRDPIGQQVQIAARDDAAPAGGNGMVLSDTAERPQVMEVAGVVKGLRHDLFDKAPVAHLYVPYGLQHRSWMNLHLGLASADPAKEAAMLQTVRRELRTVDEHLPILSLKTLTQHRDASVFYWAVKAGARIFAIFGALAMFLAVGFLIALGIGQVVGSMLYEVNGFDPVVFAAAPLVLAAAAMAACYLPARRATRIAPITALRSEWGRRQDRGRFPAVFPVFGANL
jgi:hypothetical protein